MPSKVNWYEEQVLLIVAGATDEALAQLAFQGEGIAKVNAPVDTGFMRNAIYGLAPGQSHRGAAIAEARAVDSEKELAGAPDLGEHEAGIHAAAEYSIYQETRVGYLYRALQALIGIMPGVIQRVGRVHLG